MNVHNVEPVAPQLSRIRTFLFWALAIVWFGEMVLWGAFPNIWTYFWNIIPPANPQLALLLFITEAVEAPAKGALGIMAVFGLRSKNPSTRTALFASMALVPPLNLLFPFREQGFLLEPVAVATVLSIILWGSFFLFWEPTPQLKPKEIRGSNRLPPSRWEIYQYVWFAVNSTVLTLVAFLLLFWPGTSLNFVFPCLSSLLNTASEGLPSLIYTNLAAGTHVLALAIASWIATVNCRNNPTLRQAMTIASTVNAGLFLGFPLGQVILEFGGTCAESSILIVFVPLFIGWLFYSVFSYRVNPRYDSE